MLEAEWSLMVRFSLCITGRIRRSARMGRVDGDLYKQLCGRPCKLRSLSVERIGAMHRPRFVGSGVKVNVVVEDVEKRVPGFGALARARSSKQESLGCSGSWRQRGARQPCTEGIVGGQFERGGLPPLYIGFCPTVSLTAILAIALPSRDTKRHGGEIAKTS